MPTSVAAPSWLLDTGPLVALLSRDDSAHHRCAPAFEKFRGHLVTTEAVLTEAMHLLRRSRNGQEKCLAFFERGGALLIPTNAARLTRSGELIERYKNVPMDFADAGLVALAEELSIGTVFTLDHRGFEAYRWHRTRRFVLVP